MKRSLKKFSRLLFVLFLLTFSLSVAVFLFFDKSLSYQLRLYSKQIAVNRINSDINRAVMQELSNADITYDKLVQVEKTEEGKITAIKADMVSVNILKNKLDLAIAEICLKDTYYEAAIPVGNLIGNGFMYGKGFDVKIRFRPLGDASTNMSGEFSEAGINQTLYRISFDVDVEAAVVFPFRYIEVPIKVETVIAETIIVGDVPGSFTHFDLNGDITSQDFQGYVEDYMAE